jgi:acyl-CoA thioesterase I
MKIAFFGDSICVGQGISIHNGWVTLISKFIEENNSSYNEKSLVFNSSVNGRTTRQALENMPYEIQSQKPDILIVQFGMNDSNYWESDNGLPRVSKDSFKSNIKEIISRSVNFGVKKIILNTNHPTPLTNQFNYANCSYEESNDEYNQVIRSLDFISDKVILNDINKELKLFCKSNNKTPNDLVLKDGIHLNELGHTLYYKYTKLILEKILRNE